MPAERPNDAAAAILWNCADQAVVHRLYERLGRAVISRTQRLVRRADISQEILQETFVKLWDLGPTFASERAAFAWVYKASHNLALDYLRSSFTKSELRSSEALDDEISSGPQAHQEYENRDLIRRAVAKLTAEEASVLVLKVVDHMRLDEIAAFVGGSSRTVSRILLRVEGKLARAKVAMHDKFGD